jgi:hypothetical protein
LDTIFGIYQSSLDLFNYKYHSHVEDIHILVVTKNDLLTNVQFGEMFFFIDLMFATINYGDWLWDQGMEHLSIWLIFKGMKMKENGSFSSMNDELHYMNYNTKYFFL